MSVSMEFYESFTSIKYANMHCIDEERDDNWKFYVSRESFIDDETLLYYF